MKVDTIPAISFLASKIPGDGIFYPFPWYLFQNILFTSTLSKRKKKLIKFAYMKPLELKVYEIFKNKLGQQEAEAISNTEAARIKKYEEKKTYFPQRKI